MRKILLMSSALVVSGLLSGGAANAACIQTPTCSSLGYTSSSSCTGGTKCPFGNAWNCTGPNNTTEINNLKTEISNIKTDITNIKTNITNLTNRITNIENNSSSGSGTGGYSVACLGCSIGNIYYNGNCYDVASSQQYFSNGYVVYAKENGKCKAASLAPKSVTIRDVTDADRQLSKEILEECSNSIFNDWYQNSITIFSGVKKVVKFADETSGTYEDFVIRYRGCRGDTSYVISNTYQYSKKDFEDMYYSRTLPVPEGISF